MSLLKTRPLGVVRYSGSEGRQKILKVSSNTPVVARTNQKPVATKPRDPTKNQSMEKNTRNLNSDPNAKLLAEIERLKKIIAQLEDEVQEKAKTIDDIKNQLKDQVVQHEKVTMEMSKEHDSTKERLSSVNAVLQKIEDQLRHMEEDFASKLRCLTEQMETERASLRAEMEREIHMRDEKITKLKKQIGDTLLGNSLVRQRQLEEMTKEFEKIQDEAESLRSELNSTRTILKSNSKEKPCPDCRNRILLLKFRDKEIQQRMNQLQTGEEYKSDDEDCIPTPLY